MFQLYIFCTIRSFDNIKSWTASIFLTIDTEMSHPGLSSSWMINLHMLMEAIQFLALAYERKSSWREYFHKFPSHVNPSDKSI